MVQAPHGPSILKDTQSTLGGYVPRLVMSETWNQCRGSSCGNHVTSTSGSLGPSEVRYLHVPQKFLNDHSFLGYFETWHHQLNHLIFRDMPLFFHMFHLFISFWGGIEKCEASYHSQVFRSIPYFRSAGFQVSRVAQRVLGRRWWRWEPCRPRESFFEFVDVSFKNQKPPKWLLFFEEFCATRPPWRLSPDGSLLFKLGS